MSTDVHSRIMIKQFKRLIVGLFVLHSYFVLKIAFPAYAALCKNEVSLLFEICCCNTCLQCFDAVDLAAGRASGL